jgi:hypothetical protein
MMKTIMRRVLPFLLVGVAATVLVASDKVNAQKDPKFDFSRLETWSWSPSPGDVKVWVTAESKSEPVKQQYEPIIMQSVQDELTRLGFTRSSGSPPDFNVTYYVLVTLGSASQQMGQFLPAVTEWGLPPFAPQTTALRVYPLGTLVLDVESADRVVWRGVAQAEINLERTDRERAARLQKVVRDLLAKFPRTRKK